MDITNTLLPIIIVLVVLYALGWHDQPAKNPEKARPRDQQAPPKQRKEK